MSEDKTLDTMIRAALTGDDIYFQVAEIKQLIQDRQTEAVKAFVKDLETRLGLETAEDWDEDIRARGLSTTIDETLKAHLQREGKS